MKNHSASELEGTIKVSDLRNLQSLASAFNASLPSEIIESDVDAFWIVAKNACKNIRLKLLCDTSVWFRSNSYALVRSLALDGLMFNSSMNALRFSIAPGRLGLICRDLRVEASA